MNFDFPEEKKPCVWQPIAGQSASEGGIRCRCIFCGWVTEPFDPVQGKAPRRDCDSDQQVMRCPVKLPGIFERAANFAKSLAQHLAHGKPQSTREEILESFRICSPCEYYNDLAGMCGACGCYVNLALYSENLNKLAWADEACPKEKWKAPLLRRQDKL